MIENFHDNDPLKYFFPELIIVWVKPKENKEEKTHKNII